ncbi:MAG: hypothetical protein LUH05_09630 [Candidatus Gastranaerophilales bacterium]|nr:hypothetical protein [Candidatus Gastranaerophilales bacterium]
MEFDATFLIAVISFIVFVFIMNKIFYAPILKIMKERQEFTENNFKSARLTEEETKKQTAYRDGELEKSRDEARLKVAQELRQLKQEKAKSISDYKCELFGNVADEKENLKKSALSAKEILSDNIADIAKEISTKLLGDSINPELINKPQIEEEQV